MLQDHPLPRRERGVQCEGVVRLDPDDSHLRPLGLDVGGDPGDEAAATDLDEDRVERLALLRDKAAENHHFPLRFARRGEGFNEAAA